MAVSEGSVPTRGVTIMRTPSCRLWRECVATTVVDTVSAAVVLIFVVYVSPVFVVIIVF